MPAGAERARALTAIVVVVLATAGAFVPTLGNDFVEWDDHLNFRDNPHYRGFGPAQLAWMWTTMHTGHYIPVTWMSLGLDYLVWGLDPTGYHLTNLLLHVLVAALFYLLAARLLSLALAVRPEAPAVVLGAAAAALLFAVHPLRVESVAWATERRDVLSGVFYVGACLAYLRFATVSVRRWRWYALALGLFVLGVLSKSTVVTLPVALLALDVHPLRRLARGRRLAGAARAVLLEKAPFLAVAAAGAVVAFTAVLRADVMASTTLVTIPERLLNAADALAFYLGKMVLPVHLSPMYELKKPFDPLSARYAVAALVVVGLTAGALALRRRWPACLAVWVVHVVTLLPMSGLFQNGPQVAADRYTYLAGMGFAVLGGGVVVGALQSGVVRPPVMGSLAAAVVLALGALTWQQTHVWRDTVTLWSHALRVDPASAVAARNLGLELGRRRPADATFDRVAVGVPLQGGLDSPSSAAAGYFALAVALQRAGDSEGAIAYYGRTVGADPTFHGAWNNLGVVYAVRGDYPRAFNAFLRAVALAGPASGACDNALRAARMLGRTEPALSRCQPPGG
jgi:hypothetical protein